MNNSESPKMFQPYGTESKKKNVKKRKTYKENKAIIDAICDGDTQLVRELVSESILKRVDKPVTKGMYKGGKQMEDAIFKD